MKTRLYFLLSFNPKILCFSSKETRLSDDNSVLISVKNEDSELYASYTTNGGKWPYKRYPKYLFEAIEEMVFVDKLNNKKKLISHLLKH